MMKELAKSNQLLHDYISSLEEENFRLKEKLVSKNRKIKKQQNVIRSLNKKLREQNNKPKYKNNSKTHWGR